MSASEILMFECEQVCLGTLLVEGKAGLLSLQSDEFLDRKHRLISAAILELTHEGAPISILSVAERLQVRGELSDAGGRAYLAYLTDNAHPLSTYAYYESKVRDFAQARKVYENLTDSTAQLDRGSDVQIVLDGLFERLNELQYRDSNSIVYLDEIMLEKPDWLIEEILTRDSIAVLYAPPKAYKTFIAVSMAYCVAAGVDFMGHKVNLGRVLYLAAEGRRAFLTRVHGCSVFHEKELPPRSFALSEPIGIGSPSAVHKLITQSRAQGMMPDLIVIDTLNKNFGTGGKENSADDMAAFFAGCERLKREFHCAVLVLHHTGRGDLDRVRGSSAIEASVDFSYKVEKSSDESSGRIIPKLSRDFSLGDVLAFDVQQFSFSRHGHEDSFSTLVLTKGSEKNEAEFGPVLRTDNDKLAHGQLLELAGEAMECPLQTWRDRMVVDLNFDRRVFSAIKKRFLDKGIIFISSDESGGDIVSIVN
ncbi:AAA family ATPase [Spirochaeta dissipatitropha]